MTKGGKSVIFIERPEGKIPGLIEVNSYLAEHHGVVVAAVIDKHHWVGVELHTAKIEGDSIIQGDVLLSAP